MPLALKSYIKIGLRLLRGDKYLSYRFHPDEKLYSSYDNETYATAKNHSESFAIVIQGPYQNNNNFTLNTIKRYRKYYPKSIIILSTWTVPDTDKKLLSSLNVVTLTNEIPENPGISNVNYQIVTSRNGIHTAKNLGATFVLKTRTDQRIYNPNTYKYLISLLNGFPLSNRITEQHARLIACSLNTFKLRLYGISDMFLFGYTEDVLRYWDVPFDERNPLEYKSHRNLSWRDHSALELCEVYFCANYLRSLNGSVEFTLEASLKQIASHFIVIDQHAIGMFWNKYTYDENRYMKNDFYDPQLSFNDWFFLYSAIDDITYDERMLDLTT